MRKALKGRANNGRNFFPDSRFITALRLNISFVDRPYRARS